MRLEVMQLTQKHESTKRLLKTKYTRIIKWIIITYLFTRALLETKHV